MAAPNDALTLQLLEWIERGDRSYAETVETWRSTCPRLSIWEDACADGLIDYAPDTRTVRLSPKGSARLAAARETPVTDAGTRRVAVKL